MRHPRSEKAGPTPAEVRLGTLAAAFEVQGEAEAGTGAAIEAGSEHAGGTEVAAGVRQVRKQRTRQALLDAALELLEQQSLSSLGLREVTRAAGIAPAAFYRHFPDIAALGVALVEESFGSLRAMVREIRAQGGDVDDVIGRSVDVIAEHVHEQPAHFRFLARERHGGVAAVRAAIAAELDGFVRDLVDDLSAQPDSAGWSATEIRVLAELYVNHTMLTATAILEATTGEPRLGVDPEGAAGELGAATEVGATGEVGTASEAGTTGEVVAVAAAGKANAKARADSRARPNEQAIVEAARMQLRLISLGRRHWLNERPTTSEQGSDRA